MNNKDCKTYPVTEQLLRAVLDTINLSDACAGWRSASTVITAINSRIKDKATLKNLHAFLEIYSKDDLFFETSVIDGEFCMRSHKFDRNRDEFLYAVASIKSEVEAMPQHKAMIIENSTALLRSALLPQSRLLVA